MVKRESKFPILAVVYDLNFIFRVRNAFPEGAGLDVHVCRSGEETELYLRGVGVYGNRAVYPFPRLILLDTLTPDEADQKLLNLLRTNGDFPEVPVVLLVDQTGHARLQDLLDLGANAIVAKRNSAEELLTILQGVMAKENLPAPAS